MESELKESEHFHFLITPLMTPSLMILVKTRLLESQAETEE